MINKEFISDKVSIIGAGFVGSTTAFALMAAGTTSEIALIDVNEKKLEGEVMDLNHGISFVPQVRIHSGTYDDCEDSNIVIITAGVGQKPGETRVDLLKRNIDVFEDIIPKVVEHNKDCVILVVTNPVDILTYAALKISGLPDNQVIGSGTVLDSARFRYLLGNHCDVAPHNVHAYIIGEHGDTEVPAWSITNIAGMPIEKFCMQCGKECIKEEKEKIFNEVKNSAYRIIEGKGATYYSVALSVKRIVEAILRNENAVLPISSLMRGYYGIDGVCLSLPSIVNEDGLSRVLELQLTEDEIIGFKHSAETLKQLLMEIGFA